VAAIVGAAELPVENTFVFTACFGIMGAGLIGIGSSFLGAMLTVGAASSTTLAGAFGCWAGSRRALMGGSRLAMKTGLGNWRNGCG
jgi:hypothetical protein